MTQFDIDALAEKIHAMLVAERKQFWVDPEQHYNDHQSLHEMVQEWRTIKGMFLKTFVGLAILGSIVLAGLGSLAKFWK